MIRKLNTNTTLAITRGILWRTRVRSTPIHQRITSKSNHKKHSSMPMKKPKSTPDT